MRMAWSAWMERKIKRERERERDIISKFHSALCYHSCGRFLGTTYDFVDNVIFCGSKQV